MVEHLGWVHDRARPVGGESVTTNPSHQHPRISTLPPPQHHQRYESEDVRGWPTPPLPPDPPPRPPHPPTPSGNAGKDDLPRSTAASWVGAAGALLLLIAAVIFLAVSWDGLGLTARIVVIASVTAAAIVGGHRIRSMLPVVGAIVFHLGVSLVPVNVVGLALHLELGTGAVWLLPGMAMVVTFPPLAILGRSRVLAAAALVGVTVLATGIGLTTPVAPSVVVALAALLLVGLVASSSPVIDVWKAGTVALAATSVLMPLIATALEYGLARGQLVAALSSAGWALNSWQTPAIAGVLAVAATATRATLARSWRLAVMTPVLAGVAVITTLIPSNTPRLAWLLIAPVALLLCEIAGLLGRHDALWGRVGERLAAAGELLAIPVVLAAAQLVVFGPWLMTEADGEVAVALGVGGSALMTAAVRRMLASPISGSMARDRGTIGGRAVLLVGAAVVMSTAMLVAAMPTRPSVLPTIVLLTVVAGWILVDRAVANTATTRWYAPARAAVATLLIVLAAGASIGTAATLVVAILAAPLVGGHLWGLHRHPDGVPITVALAPVGVLVSVICALLPVDAAIVEALSSVPIELVQLGVFTGAVLALAACIDRVAVLADLARGFVGLMLLFALGTSWTPATLTEGVSTPAQRAVLELLTPAPALLVVLAPAILWLLVDTVRTQRMRIALIVAPLTVRLVASIVAAASAGSVALGLVLVTFAIITAISALMVRDLWLRLSLSAAAGIAGIAGWVLIDVSPHARAFALIGAGMAIVTGGVLTKRPVASHLGGVTATFGVWTLLSLQDIWTVDVWLLPVALQWLVTAIVARRSVRASSWVLETPPILLVVVAAIGERLAGAPSWHALLAGLVAVAATVYGGVRGRGGPITSGIVSILVIIFIETVAYAALVSTWAWFAIGGAVLLVTAVLIERRGSSPRRASRLRNLLSDPPTED